MKSGPEAGIYHPDFWPFLLSLRILSERDLLGIVLLIRVVVFQRVLGFGLQGHAVFCFTFLGHINRSFFLCTLMVLYRLVAP